MQKAKAQEFKTYDLNAIFAEINAASASEVELALASYGPDLNINRPDGSSYTFRKQFTATSNQELIFNPFYLLKAFEFYDERFDNFNGNVNSDEQWNRRNIFWRQVIGYIQRHLPACHLQAFAQGICDLAQNGSKLKRNFKFEDEFFLMKPLGGR